MIRAVMTDTALEKRIADFAWYQRIPLGDGSHTPGEDTYTESKLPLLRLPEDLTGKSVLDIGCGEGFFSFEAERRGAGRILSIDKAEGSEEKFELLRRHFGSRAEFRGLAVDELDPAELGAFDVVIFLSVLQHLPDPFAALARIAGLAGGLAVMEVCIATAAEPVAGFDDEPLMVRRLRGSKRSHVLPNLAMLHEMLAAAGFDRVEILTTHRSREITGYGHRYFQERAILHAHKGA
jgi:tRNA (mo5U34)-methyltransferase